MREKQKMATTIEQGKKSCTGFFLMSFRLRQERNLLIQRKDCGK